MHTPSLRSSWLLVAWILSLICCVPTIAIAGKPVEVPAGIVHQSYDGLLKKYVDAQGLVAYGRWKENKADVAKLDRFLEQYQRPGAPNLGKEEKSAALINVYNALMIRWVIGNYPLDSIWEAKHSLTARRHCVGGQMVSLNQIEHDTLRPLLGWRVHSTIVCAARSCPPLQRFAYQSRRLDSQIESAYRTWLARKDLNRFDVERRTAHVSKVFKWFKKDFKPVGGVKPILARFGPSEVQPFADLNETQLKYLPYRWGLNDQGSRGARYGQSEFIGDAFSQLVRF